MSLKALANKVLLRNKTRNNGATEGKKLRNFLPKKTPEKLRGFDEVLDVLKFEDIPLEATAETVKSPSCRPCSSPERDIPKNTLLAIKAVNEVGIFEKQESLFDEDPERVANSTPGSQSSLAVSMGSDLPVWCSRSCTCLEELDLPDGKVLGCVQEHSAWEQEWQRLSTHTSCPVHYE